MKVKETVRHLMKQGKGILAADESVKTITERFQALGIESTEDTRRLYRELLVTTPGMEAHLSGVILYDETLRQALTDGTPFPQYLFERNVLPGIKVDLGIEHDPQFGGGVTKGLDGLRGRLKEYVGLGARFAKWRATTAVGTPHGAPHVRENASRMAVYAEECIAEGLVPIVEPEVLMDGMHTAAEAEETLVETLSVTIDALSVRDIDLRSVIIKTSMAVSGKDAVVRADSREVAERTVRALVASIPEETGGVVFLSGGQTPQEATENLNAIARMEPLPWDVTFSFARAIQGPALDAWRGVSDNAPDAQSIFLERLSLLTAADAAGYTKNAEEGSLQEL
jgi:fructose-bisphosphate aldolase class I